MKKSISSKIAAVIYAVAAVMMLAVMFPIITLSPLSQVPFEAIIQIVAAIVFIKLAIDLFTKRDSVKTDTAFFAYNLVYVLFTGICFEIETTMFALGFNYLGLAIDTQVVFYILLAVKLILVAAAALFATMEEKEEAIQVQEVSEETVEIKAEAEVLEETKTEE